MKHFVGEQFRVSQNFLQEDDFTRKTYKSGVHFGTDFATPVGTPLYSPCEGKIADVVLNHASLGDAVTEGTIIAQTGDTGMGHVAHLHVDIMKKPFVFANLLSKATVQQYMVDPLEWLKTPGIVATPDLSTYTSKQLLEELTKRL